MAKHISRIERPVPEKVNKHNKIPCLDGYVFSDNRMIWQSGSRWKREKRRA